MRNPRHFFILIGLMAQGMTWDSNAMLLALIACWGLAIASRRFHVGWFGPWYELLGTRRHKVALITEAAALVIGCVASLLISRQFDRTAHFFLGDGLALLQLVRLARPSLRREKLTALIIATFHFGVLCTLAPNVRFVILFAGAIVVFPKALKEVLISPDDGVMLGDPRYGLGAGRLTGIYRYVLPPPVYFALILMSAGAFLTFPRFTGTPLHLRNGLVDSGSLLDSVLDPRRSGRGNSAQVLMQVEGEDIGYLRCFSLTEFDGIKWKIDDRAPLQRFRRDDYAMQTSKSRIVYVKNPSDLGRILPLDGRPADLGGNFFSPPFVSLHQTVEVNGMWNTGDNWYRYWLDTTQRPDRLAPGLRDNLLWHPPQSAALKAWVEDKARAGTNELSRARAIETHLRRNFQYELGTPELNRLSPVDEFVFERRAGHCERFAAAMGLFLRMQGIPSRVVIGYVPTSRNLFTGRLQVRFRDAHSWAEGYFDGLGWVSFDATPGPSAAGGVASELRDFLDALDFFWYSQVVNFNGFGQRELLNAGLEWAARISDNTWRRLGSALGMVFLLFATVRFAQRPWWTWWKAWRREPTPQTMARHQYGAMLAVLERNGWPKPPQATPIEFLRDLRLAAFPKFDSVALVTEAFCESEYGGKVLPPEKLASVEEAVAGLHVTEARTEAA